MNKDIMTQILDKIKEYDRIMIFRHVRNDGDCVGATKGMKRILQLTFPEKEIYLIDSDTAQYLEFLGPEDEPVADEVYTETLHYSDDDGEEYFDTLEEFLAQYGDKYGLKADATLEEAMAAVNASEDGLLAQISEE